MLFHFLLFIVVLTGGAEFDWILIPAMFLVLDNIDIGRVCGLLVVCSAKIKYCRIVLSQLSCYPTCVSHEMRFIHIQMFIYPQLRRHTVVTWRVCVCLVRLTHILHTRTSPLALTEEGYVGNESDE